jgi:putative stress-induced transcription regulator
MRLVTLAESPSAEGQPLFVEFVNTLHWYEGAPIELIGGERTSAAWLLEHALPVIDVEGCLPEVHRLREHVRGLTEALASRRSPPERDMEAVDAARP